MKYIDRSELQELLQYAPLIEALKNGFRQGGETPLRHAHNITQSEGAENLLLLMPSWQQDSSLGIKITMVCPDNKQHDLGMVQSTYMLSDARTGVLKALLDGDELTFRRTSCASALASSYLSNPDAKTLLMLGAGKLAPHLVQAHASVRKFENIYVWDIHPESAQKMAEELNRKLPAEVKAITDREKYANMCDIISTATPSPEPILEGKWLDPNKEQHIDLVGGYTYNMREADDDVIRMSDVFVDTFDGALAEAGDILQPIDNGIITKTDIRGDLFNLVDQSFSAKRTQSKTVFKSVGTALEDLIAANFAYENSTG